MTTAKTASKKAAKKIKYEPMLKLAAAALRPVRGAQGQHRRQRRPGPILVDEQPHQKIIDGNYRKQIADELGYDCPEIVHERPGRR